MKRLYKNKSNRFSSFISLMFLAGMVLFFLMVLPEFLSMTTGRIFAVSWAVMAIFVFTAHARVMSTEERMLKAPFSITSLDKKDMRAKKVMEKNLLRQYKSLG